MAQNQARITCPPGTWTELTNSDATQITFQVVTGSVKIRATSGPAPAALSDVGYIYHARPVDSQGEAGELRIAMSDLSATLSSGRLFATPVNGRTAKVIIDHA